MDYLTGSLAGRAIIDNGASLTTLDSAAKAAYTSKTPTAGDHIELLLRNYRPILTGSSKVAGRDCYSVRLEPRYAGNPSKRLWIDKKNLVALKTEYYNSGGKVTSTSEYTSIDFNKRPSSSLFAIPRGWKTAQLAPQAEGSLEAMKQAAGFAPVKPSYAPKGYEFGGYSLCQTCRHMRCIALRYTNGLNSISVFESRGSCPGMGRGRGWRGGRGAGSCGGRACVLSQSPQGNMLRTTAGELSVILVGDIAQGELQRMAGSIK